MTQLIMTRVPQPTQWFGSALKYEYLYRSESLVQLSIFCCPERLECDEPKHLAPRDSSY
jgi:hypothetical protein